MKTKKHAHFNEVPQFLTTDIADSCVIFELKDYQQTMSCFECMFNAVKLITYDGADAVVEEPSGSNAKTIFLELRTGSILPEYYRGGGEELELAWYDNTDINGDEITLDEILTMCVL